MTFLIDQGVKLKSFDLVSRYKGTKKRNRVINLNARFDTEHLWGWKKNVRLKKMILAIYAVTL